MQITIKRCPECGTPYMPDVDLCPSCLSIKQTQSEEVSGVGKIYSFTRVHVAPEQFKDSVPYYLAIVELEAGPRLLARLKTEEGDHVRIDAPVELVSTDKGFLFSLK